MKVVYNPILSRLNELNFNHIVARFEKREKELKEAGHSDEELGRLLSELTKGHSDELKKAKLKWVDMDKGQLRKMGAEQKPALVYPCALIGISIPSCKGITDFSQNCTAHITITLVFDPILSARTSGGAPDEVREQALSPYDVIADVYKHLQGYCPSSLSFNPLNRISQKEVSNDKLFVYQIVFATQFEDNTAEG